jgi:hypothetical protein
MVMPGKFSVIFGIVLIMAFLAAVIILSLVLWMISLPLLAIGMIGSFLDWLANKGLDFCNDEMIRTRRELESMMQTRSRSTSSADMTRTSAVKQRA